MLNQLTNTEHLNGKSILITGGTGSLGNMLVELIHKHAKPRRIIVFSRDEYKQHVMSGKFGHVEAMRYFLGDVRDEKRLRRAFEGVDYVIHAAALKQVCTESGVSVSDAVVSIAGQAWRRDCGRRRRVGDHRSPDHRSRAFQKPHRLQA